MDPIIRSLLDTDLYKFTMAYVIRRHFPGTDVTFAFTCRNTDVNLAALIDQAELEAQLEHVRKLRFGEDELDYLKTLGLFPDEGFFDFLRTVQLPKVRVRRQSDGYQIEVTGPWAAVSFWEIYVLAIVNQLYAEAELASDGRSPADALAFGGRQRLKAKIQRLRQYPDLKITDFGTRRRFSTDWQLEVVRTLQREIPGQMAGTSNVWIARELGLTPIGTFAHEMYMGLAGIMGNTDEGLLASHNRVLQLWWKEFGQPLSIALTDTYGSDFFFADFTPEQALNWRGLRQDSGDPFEFGEKAIAFYERLGIDPRTKLIVFSDGLDLELIIKLWEHFDGRINVGFGWGTNLTFDVGLRTLSLVMKLVAVGTRRVGKLSDNWAKAIGGPKVVERLKRVFGYHSTFNQFVTV